MKKNYRFTASYEPDIPGLDDSKILAESNDLQELVKELSLQAVNDYHCKVTEYDLGRIDAYGIPEIFASARLMEIDSHMGNLSDFESF